MPSDTACGSCFLLYIQTNFWSCGVHTKNAMIKKCSFYSTQLFFAFLITCFVSACSNDDGSPKQIELAGGTSTEQTVYADQTHTDGGIRFTAQAAWTATVSDITGSRTDMPVKPDWLTLSAYSGGAGEQALALTLKENLTGHDRKALITITCGDTAITIIVEQKAVKADGSQQNSGT